jgi:hypothetical protein
MNPKILRILKIIFVFVLPILSIFIGSSLGPKNCFIALCLLFLCVIILLIYSIIISKVYSEEISHKFLQSNFFTLIFRFGFRLIIVMFNFAVGPFIGFSLKGIFYFCFLIGLNIAFSPLNDDKTLEDRIDDLDSDKSLFFKFISLLLLIIGGLWVENF